MAEIQLRNLGKRWGSFVGVDNFDLTIADRELLVLLDPSGCSKTTTMRMIAVVAPINRLVARASTNRLAALRTSTRLLSTKRPFSSEVAVDDASTPPSDAAVLSSLMAGDMPHHRLEAELGDVTNDRLALHNAVLPSPS